MMRDRPLSVPEAAAELQASEAYVRRLLIRERLYGVKVGPVWAIYREDLDNFKRLRRPPGRPPKSQERRARELEMRVHITGERESARTDNLLRKPRRKPEGRRAAPT